MTANELRAIFNRWPDEKGIEFRPPMAFEVDHETYANVVQSILNNKLKYGDVYRLGDPDYGNYYGYNITTGIKSNGIMFKHIELILKDYKE